MSDKQLMRIVTKTFEASSKGKSKEEVLGNALTDMRKKANSLVDGTILKMEPVEVYLLDEKVDVTTERFLFVFMPKEKTEYTSTYKFVVEIRYIPNDEHGRD